MGESTELPGAESRTGDPPQGHLGAPGGASAQGTEGAAATAQDYGPGLPPQEPGIPREPMEWEGVPRNRTWVTPVREVQV